MTSTTPTADPRYLHTVGWWQGMLDDLGRISATVARLTPDAPITLCGGSLVAPGKPTGPDELDLPPCPLCAAEDAPR